MELKQKLAVRLHFDSAHYLPGYPGKCAHMHGHRWNVDFTFQPFRLDDLNETGMIADFSDLKAALSKILPDHLCLNDDVPEFKNFRPTAENIAMWLFLLVSDKLIDGTWEPLEGIKLVRIEVWESPECSAIVEV